MIDNFMQDESVAKKMREEMCSMPIRYENDEEEEGGEKDALHATRTGRTLRTRRITQKGICFLNPGCLNTTCT